MAEDKEKIFDKFKEKRNDISKIRLSLNTINEQKEKFYSEKEKISNEIRKLIGEIKNFKKKRDKLTKIVKTKKIEKEKYYKQISEKIGEFSKLQAKKRDFFAKNNIKGDPISIRKQIDKLELQVETEAISFDKEQKL